MAKPAFSRSDCILNLGFMMYELGDREMRLLQDVAGRLLMGQKAYGKLTKKKKKWRREALEEAMDGMVYLGAAIQDLDDEENGTD